MAESRKHGLHVAPQRGNVPGGFVEEVSASGCAILVRTKQGHVITKPVGLPHAAVVAELKEGQSLATPEDLIAAHAASMQSPGAESHVPAPVIEGFGHKKAHVEKEKSSVAVLEKK